MFIYIYIYIYSITSYHRITLAYYIENLDSETPKV